MKKTISLLLAVLLALGILCGCASNGAPADETKETTENSLPDYAGKEIKEYDENGNIILTSTDDRQVYSYSGGFIIFSFNGQSVSNIKRVYCFSSEESAKEFVTENARKAVENGLIPLKHSVNGTNVIEDVAFSTDPANIGNYYAKTKSQIEKDFEGELVK